MNLIQVSKNFYLSEFQCPCCKKVMLDEKLLANLQELRDAINEPIIITSGFRCKLYNHKVGGVDESYHTIGKAVDITVPNMTLLEVYFLAQELQFKGFGLYEKKGFIHLDIREGNIVEWKG